MLQWHSLIDKLVKHGEAEKRREIMRGRGRGERERERERERGRGERKRERERVRERENNVKGE